MGGYSEEEEDVCDDDEELYNTPIRSIAKKERVSTARRKKLSSLVDCALEDESFSSSAVKHSPTAASGKVLLAQKYNENKDPTNWWMSEKLDGVRAVWDPLSRTFFSRNGNAFAVPAWFSEHMPDVELDGELFAGLGKFQYTLSVVKA